MISFYLKYKFNSDVSIKNPAGMRDFFKTYKVITYSSTFYVLNKGHKTDHL